MSQYTEDIKHIRKMMDKSAQFLSLSGMSGIISGVVAIISFFVISNILKREGVDYLNTPSTQFTMSLVTKLVIVAICSLLTAIGLGAFFTIRKLKNNGKPLYNSSTKNFLISLCIPLLVGGIFCISLAYNDHFYMIAPCMLIFYGLALINASKFTHDEIFWLGTLEVALGIIASFFIGYGLILWVVGFGLLHILYGMILYDKYK